MAMPYGNNSSKRAKKEIKSFYGPLTPRERGSSSASLTVGGERSVLIILALFPVSQNFLVWELSFEFFLKGPFVYGEVRTGRVGVTAGSLQWKDCWFVFSVVLVIWWFVSYVVISVKGVSARGLKSTSTLFVKEVWMLTFLCRLVEGD
jgi:hypothetical protein